MSVKAEGADAVVYEGFMSERVRMCKLVKDGTDTARVGIVVSWSRLSNSLPD